MEETNPRKPRVPMRKILIWIAAAMGVALVVVSITEIEDIIKAVQSGKVLFILLAIALQLACLANNSLNYRTLYRILGLQEDWLPLFLQTTASQFVNMIAPSGGLVGMTVYLNAARKRGNSPAKVMVSGILYIIYEYLSLLSVLALSFIALIQRNNLTAGELIAASLLLLFTILLAFVVYLGYRSSRQLGELLFRLANWANRLLFRFFKRNVIPAEQAHILAAEISEGVAALRGKKARLIIPFLFAILNKALLIGVLSSIFLALAVPFSTATVVAGYSVAQLFFYVSPTPAGVGFVEGIFPLTLSALLVPVGSAVLITLIYRGITVWLTFMVGFYSLHRLQRQDVALPPPADT